MENQKQETPTEFHKKAVKAQAAGITAEDLLNTMRESTDVKEKILKEVVDKLFDKQNLLMISRLDTTLAYYLIKNLIIDGFYAKYFFEIKYRIIMIQSPKPPYYRADVSYIRPDMKKLIKPIYRNFINELLQVTISFKGQGRDELIKLYDAINERIRKENLESSFLRNMGMTK